MKITTVCILFAAILARSAGAQETELNRLVETEKAFAAAAASDGAKQAFIKFFSDDGIVFQPGPVNAKEFWQGQPESPALLAWHPVWAEISFDGQLGYTTGPWEFKPAGKDGDAVAFGQYITLWQKQADGSFKAVLDLGTQHARPDANPSDWSAPEPPGEPPGSSGELATLEFLQFSEYESLLTDDARLYRSGQMPIIGRAPSLAHLETELEGVADGTIEPLQSDGSGDLMYALGKLQLTKQDGTNESGHLLRVMRFRDDQWKIALEAFIQ